MRLAVWASDAHAGALLSWKPATSSSRASSAVSSATGGRAAGRGANAATNVARLISNRSIRRPCYAQETCLSGGCLVLIMASSPRRLDSAAGQRVSKTHGWVPNNSCFFVTFVAVCQPFSLSLISGLPTPCQQASYRGGGPPMAIRFRVTSVRGVRGRRPSQIAVAMPGAAAVSGRDARGGDAPRFVTGLPCRGSRTAFAL